MEAPAFHPEPIFSAAVDGAALIAACRRALIENPPFLPAWRIERIACAARFADPELTALSPELAGRPVLLVRWQLVSGHAEALQRRLAEAHLSVGMRPPSPTGGPGPWSPSPRSCALAR